MADNYITKKDLESVIQKVRVENQNVTVEVSNSKDISKPLIDEQKKNDLKKLEESIEQRSVFQDIASGIGDMKDSLLDGFASLGESLKGLGKSGLGILGLLGGAALATLVAPIVALGAFIQQLAVEGRFLNKLSGGRLAKLFKPLKGFLSRILPFFAKIGKFFTSNSKTFRSITKFASKIGRVMGKLFLPVTILMSVFDFVKGFMKGKEEGGILIGIQEGLIAVFDGLIGSLVRMLAWIPAKIAEVLGLENLSAGITESFNKMLEGIYETFRGLVGIVKGIFTFDMDLLKESFGKVWDGITGFVTGMFSPLVGLIKDLFGADAFDKIGGMIKGIGNTLNKFFAKIQLAIVGLAEKVPFLGDADWVKDMRESAENTLKEMERMQQDLDDPRYDRGPNVPIIISTPTGSTGNTTNSSNSVTYNVGYANDASIGAMKFATGR